MFLNTFNKSIKRTGNNFMYGNGGLLSKFICGKSVQYFGFMVDLVVIVKNQNLMETLQCLCNYLFPYNALLKHNCVICFIMHKLYYIMIHNFAAQLN